MDKIKFDDAAYLREGDKPVKGDEKIEQVPVGKIRPNRYQPRTIFSKDSLKELAGSIAEKGVIQPITVRPIPLNEQNESDVIFEIVYGERRWRASQLAGLAHIPAIIKNITDRDLKIIAVIENEQREGLTFFDRMNSFVMLKDELSNVEEIAKQTRLHKRTVEKYLKIYSDISEVPELAALFEKQKESLDFKSAEVLSNKTAHIERLRKSNKRDFERIVSRLERKGIVESRGWLEEKFNKERNTGKNEKESEFLTETGNSLLLQIKVIKTTPPSEDQMQLIQQACQRFIDMIVNLKSDVEQARIINVK